MPNEITSIDTVKALFVRSFPKQLTMQYMDSPMVKIYIHDSSKDMFYELEDVRWGNLFYFLLKYLPSVCNSTNINRIRFRASSIFLSTLPALVCFLEESNNFIPPISISSSQLQETQNFVLRIFLFWRYDERNPAQRVIRIDRLAGIFH